MDPFVPLKTGDIYNYWQEQVVRNILDGATVTDW